jgi:phosphate transport system substrate-binding protein
MTQDYKKACQDVRTDQAYLQVTVNDSLVVRELVGNDHVLGLVAYSLYLRNDDKLAALEIDGVVPKSETITSEQYPLSGELYIYLKKSHADYIPGLSRFAQEFTSEQAFGDRGYLVLKNGLIPLAQVDRKVSSDIAKTLAVMSAPTD